MAQKLPNRPLIGSTRVRIANLSEDEFFPSEPGGGTGLLYKNGIGTVTICNDRGYAIVGDGSLDSPCVCFVRQIFQCSFMQFPRLAGLNSLTQFVSNSDSVSFTKPDNNA